MAVVQISKIQIRRGLKSSNSGVPQLSSAEFAWAVDSQELFIGNGSVAEGAPYVGNTKILTEHDNILDLAAAYQFASTDTSISLSVPRTLQGKIDEYVSVADFGALGNGATDCTAAFQTAFSQLFKNVDSRYKKVLMIPNGVYLISSALTVPDGVIIRGETARGAVLNIGSNNIRFVTSSGLELAEFTSSNRPKHVSFSNLTIQRTTGQVILSGLGDSEFEGVRFTGAYVLGDTVAAETSDNSAVVWINTLDGIKVTNIRFKSCDFESNSISIKCIQSAVFDTAVTFDNCKFFVNSTAVYVEGVVGQGNKWQFNDCEFEEISKQAFKSTQGRGTRMQRCQFKNCGNLTYTAGNPKSSIVSFGEKIGNVLVDCSSDRHQAAAIVSSGTIASVTEVYNGDKATFVDRNYSVIYLNDSYRPLTVFSAFNKYTVVNYVLELGTHTRVGQLTMSVNSGLSSVALTDNYQYSPSLIASTGGSLMTNFEFFAELRDNDATTGVDTVALYYKNPVATGATGSISFDVTYGV
jgi:hypothetical protein